MAKAGHRHPYQIADRVTIVRRSINNEPGHQLPAVGIVGIDVQLVARAYKGHSHCGQFRLGKTRDFEFQ